MHPSVRRASLAVVIGLTVAACGAASSPSPTGDAPSASAPVASEAVSPPPSAAAPSEAVSSAPAGSTGTGGAGTGGETVRLVVTGGPDAGTYTTDADPLCSNGLIGANGWGVQYSTADLTGATDFTSFQLVYYPDGPPAEAMFADTSLLVTVTIGPLLEGGRTYEIVDNQVDEEQSKGEGTATVEDGEPAVIRMTGTTDDGVGLEATITCPSVTRV